MGGKTGGSGGLQDLHLLGNTVRLRSELWVRGLCAVGGRGARQKRWEERRQCSRVTGAQGPWTSHGRWRGRAGTGQGVGACGAGRAGCSPARDLGGWALGDRSPEHRAASPHPRLSAKPSHIRELPSWWR